MIGASVGNATGLDPLIETCCETLLSVTLTEFAPFTLIAWDAIPPAMTFPPFSVQLVPFVQLIGAVS
jgi:hypothetical protein